jgi:hypothetical protein
MSRLPARANLEHLKKQAKTLLADLRRHSPAWKLSDAQHAVADTYGFRSWASLKAHVETLATAAPPPRLRAIVGTWTAKTPNTDQPGDLSFERAALDVDIVDDVVTFREVVVRSAGAEQQSESTLRVDGEEHAVAHGYSVMSWWLDDNSVQATVTNRGRLVSRVIYRVSDDGGSLTVLATADAHNGYPAVTRATVFERRVPRISGRRS